jgi:hypothetical protein
MSDRTETTIFVVMEITSQDGRSRHERPIAAYRNRNEAEASLGGDPTNATYEIDEIPLHV